MGSKWLLDGPHAPRPTQTNSEAYGTLISILAGLTSPSSLSSFSPLPPSIYGRDGCQSRGNVTLSAKRVLISGHVYFYIFFRGLAKGDLKLLRDHMSY
ncbi:hypothetical protein E2C01_063504 [Portunus trituberculatus]|uniref:Uncharacterized protein n=1 Tax=Portunus trituberculatus TaxID=210409 RepID=A0A5B7HH82_PORTR|nr:hypothetical protein [Portunus trituberculatus]